MKNHCTVKRQMMLGAEQVRARLREDDKTLLILQRRKFYGCCKKLLTGTRFSFKPLRMNIYMRSLWILNNIINKLKVTWFN